MNRLRFFLLFLAVVAVGSVHSQEDCRVWPQWQAFSRAYLSLDGRVVDHSTAQLHTVSEGQAYALFFALVAGERERFQTILKWTEDNLAQGDLSANLPGWQWGKTAQGQWQLLDANPASDADLWVAYSLLEAGRLWDQPQYTQLGQRVAAQLLASSTAVLPGLGRTLLPAPKGFALDGQRWRLNPSYVPMPVLRRMATLFAGWQEMLEPAQRLLVESAPAGFSPEWMIWDAREGWQLDADTRGESSYNAIRTYLWAGMSRRDPSFERLALTFTPWLRWVQSKGATPERINAFAPAPATASDVSVGPVGFDAAALPLADSLGLVLLRQDLQNRISQSLQKSPPGYYSHALLVFGQGWLQGRYRFAPDGALQLPLGSTCL